MANSTTLEVFPQPDVSLKFSGSTLLLPALSVGNLGQLAVDLLVTGLSLKRVASVESPLILPCVGNDPYGPTVSGALHTAFEVYQDDQQLITVLQQRSAVSKGRMREFATASASWASKQGFKEVVVLSGLSSTWSSGKPMDGLFYMNGDRGTDARCSALGFASLAGIVGDQEEAVSLESHPTAGNGTTWGPGLEFGRFPCGRLLKGFTDSGLPSLILAKFCSEGDNSGDAALLASGVAAVLQLEVHKWPRPLSWDSVYGPRGDAA